MKKLIIMSLLAVVLAGCSNEREVDQKELDKYNSMMSALNSEIAKPQPPEPKQQGERVDWLNTYKYDVYAYRCNGFEERQYEDMSEPQVIYTFYALEPHALAPHGIKTELAKTDADKSLSIDRSTIPFTLENGDIIIVTYAKDNHDEILYMGSVEDAEKY